MMTYSTCQIVQNQIQHTFFSHMFKRSFKAVGTIATVTMTMIKTNCERFKIA